jgi:hypothetical protein
LQLEHVLREGVGVAVQRPPDRVRHALVRSRRAAESQIDAAGNSASSVPNCSAITSGA